MPGGGAGDGLPQGRVRLYNSLTRKKESFEPADPNDVRMYVCGPTVYGRAHVGNARPAVVFDVLYRKLARQYGFDKVMYVRNITDLDDKIIAVARDRGDSAATGAVAMEFADYYRQDMGDLACFRPNVTPWATEHVPQMVTMCLRLIDAGHAYVSEGHVMFDVASFPAYGELNNRDPRDNDAGSRVEVGTHKRGDMDFVLWKPAKYGEPGWESPWGRGRPGWHIECSAMLAHRFRGPVDIHGGGMDLKFPHHENEIAQTRCSEGYDPARFWVHVGLVTSGGGKMAKSAGNLVTVRDVLDHTPGESVRLALLMARYREPIEWSARNLHGAHLILHKFYSALMDARDVEPTTSDVPVDVELALDDDLNTSVALACMHALCSRLVAAQSLPMRAHCKGALLAAGSALGLLAQEPEDFLDYMKLRMGPARLQEISEQIGRRREVRLRGDYETADRIRRVLELGGVVLVDGPDGSHWRMDGHEQG